MGSISAEAPPIINISPFYGDNESAKKNLVAQVQAACLSKGFFQITNHPIPIDLQEAVFAQSKTFFALPMSEKLKYDKRSNPTTNRGYETFGSQDFEKTGRGDLKEGYYAGVDVPLNHPSIGKFNIGPNVYPTNLPDPAAFKTTIDTYTRHVTSLAHDILSILALTLSLPATHFVPFHGTSEHPPIATLRLLHYPPQAPTSDEKSRGIGAHTDFGAITLLLQDSVGGLQVHDTPTNSWIDVVPVRGALVVNLGNMMMRWTNDRYVSNLHRVINKSGKERYSVPFFFSGDPDFVVECLPGREGSTDDRPEQRDSGKKYGPVKVEDWMRGRYADTYKEGNKEEAVADLRAEHNIK